jgi:hypothetical protein
LFGIALVTPVENVHFFQIGGTNEVGRASSLVLVGKSLKEDKFSNIVITYFSSTVADIGIQK